MSTPSTSFSDDALSSSHSRQEDDLSQGEVSSTEMDSFIPAFSTQGGTAAAAKKSVAFSDTVETRQRVGGTNLSVQGREELRQSEGPAVVSRTKRPVGRPKGSGKKQQLLQQQAQHTNTTTTTTTTIPKHVQDAVNQRLDALDQQAAAQAKQQQPYSAVPSVATAFDKERQSIYEDILFCCGMDEDLAATLPENLSPNWPMQKLKDEKTRVYSLRKLKKAHSRMCKFHVLACRGVEMTCIMAGAPDAYGLTN